MVIPDGAADLARRDGRSPLHLAHTEAADFLARHGVCGRARTLVPDLPRESLVAQLGMLGWDPYEHYPHGRASAEFLAVNGGRLRDGDLAFRANLCLFSDDVLVSYSAEYIESAEAEPLLEKIKRSVIPNFESFEIYHNEDFRNTLVIRDCGIDPRELTGPKPHNSHGERIDLGGLLTGRHPASRELAERINRFLVRVAEVLDGERANALFPWSPSQCFRLPPFAAHSGFAGRAAVVARMDFLHGVARAGGLEFFGLGTGRPATDFAGKGAKVVELLDEGYEFVLCHVNAPDEASHLGDMDLKIETVEQIDRHVLTPVVEYFRRRPDELGGVLVIPDHYTNVDGGSRAQRRMEVHSLHPVPFALWNGVDRDEVAIFSEDAVLEGRFGEHPVDRLELLPLLLGRHRALGARQPLLQGRG